jgi:transcription elongation GreA/GreB family factor
MSRAFVKEHEDDDPAEDLADRLVSAHPNLVTPAGLASIEAEIERAQAARQAARVAEDKPSAAAAARDLRYWQTRHATAQAQPAPEANGAVQFGSAVTIVREDGRRQTFRIVGEDEADPAKGTVSYVSPLARAVMDKRRGEEVKVAGANVEITEIG